MQKVMNSDSASAGPSFGQFSVQRELGKEPLGALYLARDQRSGNSLVIKLNMEDGGVDEWCNDASKTYWIKEQ